MELAFDIILLAASATAVVYCYALNRRLKTLKDTAASLGVTIAAMSKTVEQARETVVLAKQSSKESVDELTPLVREANDLTPRLTSLIDVVSDLAETKIAEIQATADDAVGRAEAALDAASIERRATVDAAKRPDFEVYAFDEFDADCDFFADPPPRAPARRSPLLRASLFDDDANAMWNEDAA